MQPHLPAAASYVTYWTQLHLVVHIIHGDCFWAVGDGSCGCEMREKMEGGREGGKREGKGGGWNVSVGHHYGASGAEGFQQRSVIVVINRTYDWAFTVNYPILNITTRSRVVITLLHRSRPDLSPDKHRNINFALPQTEIHAPSHALHF